MGGTFFVGIFGEGLFAYVFVLFPALGLLLWFINNKKSNLYLEKFEQIWVKKGFPKFIFEILAYLFVMGVWAGIFFCVAYTAYFLGLVD